MGEMLSGILYRMLRLRDSIRLFHPIALSWKEAVFYMAEFLALVLILIYFIIIKTDPLNIAVIIALLIILFLVSFSVQLNQEKNENFFM
jgi:hypothetical protein